MELKEEKRKRTLLTTNHKGNLTLYRISEHSGLKIVSKLSISGNIRTTRLFNNWILMCGFKYELFIVDFTKISQPKLIKKISGFNCSGLNDCFDVRQSTQTLIGYDKKNEIKQIFLDNSFQVVRHPLSNFYGAHIFKFLELQKSLIICTEKHILDLDYDTFKEKRRIEFKFSGAILIDCTKDQKHFFITSNDHKMFIFGFDEFKLVRTIVRPERFITLANPRDSPFLFGGIDGNFPIFYGRPRDFFGGFK